MTDSLSQYCLNCETQANTIEELRAANERWAITFKQAKDDATGRIEALQADKAKLRETLKQIEASTYPRPLGKSWRMDLSSSKHDRCIHDEWMYDTCEGCLDDFIRKALQETER